MSDSNQVVERPSIVEKVQLTWGNWDRICEFVKGRAFVSGVWLNDDGEVMDEGKANLKAPGNKGLGLLINNPTGTVLVEGDDYVGKAANGTYWPIRQGEANG